MVVCDRSFRLGQHTMVSDILRILLSVAVAAAAGCAKVQLTPGETAVTTMPVDQGFGLAGELRVPAGSRLTSATVDGRKAYCSEGTVAFNPGEARGACFFDQSDSGYFDEWYMLGTISSATLHEIHIPYLLKPRQTASSQQPRVDVDWNKRSQGQGSNGATENAIRWRDAALGRPVCSPTADSAFCAELRAKQRTEAAQAAVSERLAQIKTKQEAGRKLTGEERALVAQADADEASARLAARTAEAHAAAAALQRQSDELAHQRQLAGCTAAADAVALSVRSTWGGILAGLATGAACMEQ
jgi:hypothetical protein